jgi:16S rRNA C967 or C1407 C5-methylase (RsmB/RsmF family)/NOL1/NOP2/fmu family ribosome biogenesis protein
LCKNKAFILYLRSKYPILQANSSIMTLPQAFLDSLQPLLSPEEFIEFIAALTETESPTSVRLNPGKCSPTEAEELRRRWGGKGVDWCPEGVRLARRPQFTLDPLLHAGVYYVQEEASMFVTHALRSLLPLETPLMCLDLCAAPGGKSSALLSVMPEGSCLVSNEVDRKRVRILGENLTKWGAPHVAVTSASAGTLGRLRHTFDVILTDVPCSGEGMFRKDVGAVADWSPAKVADCARLQREILNDIWPALKPGGLLIYSTCTFNAHEDEEQVQFLVDELGAEPLAIPMDPSWGIHAPLQGELPACRFMPHRTPGEGLFMAAVRKPDDEPCRPYAFRGRGPKPNAEGKAMAREAARWLNGEQRWEFDLSADGVLWGIPAGLMPLVHALRAEGVYLLQCGVPLATAKGKDLIPEHALALTTQLAPEAFPQVEVEEATALSYLRRDALTPEPTWPRGYLIVAFRGHPLGFVKNLGTRCNNLYPQEWRIRKL